MSEPWRLSAVSVARALREREIGAVELTRAILARIDGPGRALNAVVTLDRAGALAAAEDADAVLARGDEAGPLCGVPVTVKESFDVAGLRATGGWHRLAHRVATRDATVVERLRRAGAVPLGKTNVPALAGDWQTDNPLFGPTRNPWNVARTPGGSSGGSAAAVAAGLSFLDVGSDLGGSLRVPAAFCGVVTLKPTEWRVSGAGHVPDDGIPETGGVTGLTRHMGVYGPIARHVEDLELAMASLVGSDPRAPLVSRAPWRPAPPRRAASLRVAWLDRLHPAPLSRESAAVLDRFVAALGDAGVTVDSLASPGFDVEAAWESWGIIAGAEAAAVGSPAALRSNLEAQRASVCDSPMERGFLEGLLGRTAPYFEALAARGALIRAIDALLEERDALLLPVTTGPAFTPRADGSPVETDGRAVRYVDYVAGHVVPLSYSGHPVVVLPAGRTAAGLPVGVQLVGRRHGDEALLAAAAAVEGAIGPWPFPPIGPGRA